MDSAFQHSDSMSMASNTVLFMEIAVHDPMHWDHYSMCMEVRNHVLQRS